LPAATEAAEHGVGELAVDLDVLFARERVAVAAVGRATVAQHADEEIAEKVGQ